MAGLGMGYGFRPSPQGLAEMMPGDYRPTGGFGGPGGYAGSMPYGLSHAPGLMRLAGDVVPMHPGAQDLSTAIERLIRPGVNPGAQGQTSVNAMGGARNPRLDLMNILQYPQGGSMSPFFRR